MINIEIGGILTALIIVGFIVNIPFYIAWLKRQKPSEEVYLYMVRGKFTYLNVIALIDRIEIATGKELRRERQKIEQYYNTSQKRGKSFKAYRSKVYPMLRGESFGKPQVINALRRMPLYTRIVAIWDLLIFMSIINIIVLSFMEDSDVVYASIVGTVFGIIPASIVWFVCHLAFNVSLKASTEKRLKSIDSIPFRIAMAQFWAFTYGLFWRDIYWVDGGASWLSASDYFPGRYWSSGYSHTSDFNDFGGFGGGDFGGGGAGGDW